MQALALLSWYLLVSMRHQHIGSAVPIGIGIITGVITGPLGFVLVPFLRHRNTREHHMLNIAGSHLLKQLGHAGAFLEKIHVVQVRIAVAIIPRHSQRAANANENSKTQRKSFQTPTLLKT